MTPKRKARVLGAGVGALLVFAGWQAWAEEAQKISYKVEDGPSVKAINASLTGKAGDPVTGEATMINRKKGNCFGCHEVAALSVKARTNPKGYADMGRIGPRLDGVASRYTEGELRMLLTDAKQIFPETIMPSFYRTEGFYRVMGKFKDKTVIGAQDVEDILAYLMTLKEPQRGKKVKSQ